MGLEPLGTRVLIRKDPWQKVSRGGVLLGGGNVPRPFSGTVLAVGEKCAEGLRPGDRVLFPSWASTTESLGERGKPLHDLVALLESEIDGVVLGG